MSLQLTDESQPCLGARVISVRVLALVGALATVSSGCADAEETGRQAPRAAAPTRPEEQQDEEPAPPDAAPQQSPGNGTCEALSTWVAAAETPTSCDAALAAACADFIGLWSPQYLSAIGECIDGGHSPMTCIFVALGELEPTAAHHQLATRFCDECAFGAPGCEELFYFDDDQPIGLGVVALPLSDAVVEQIAAECTDGLTCAVELPSCARDVIEAQIAAGEVLDCLMSAVGG